MFKLIVAVLVTQSFVRSTVGAEVNNYVSGGSATTIASYPFMVALTISTSTCATHAPFCSGTLLRVDRTQAVLTAASCFDNFETLKADFEAANPSCTSADLFAIQGATYINPPNVNSNKIPTISALLQIHPNYDVSTKANDVALFPLFGDR